MLNKISENMKLKDSRSLLMDNDKIAMSNNAGNGFPTEELYIGMRCYRTDLDQMYILTDEDNGVWKLETDFKQTDVAGESYVKLNNDALIQFGTIKSVTYSGPLIVDTIDQHLVDGTDISCTFENEFKELPVVVLQKHYGNHLTHPEWSLKVDRDSITTKGFKLIPTFDVSKAKDEINAAYNKANKECPYDSSHGQLLRERMMGYDFSWIAIGRM